MSETRALRSRLDFSKIPTAIQIPNLIEVQRRSYERFLQMDKLPQEREDNGLQSVFTSVFPITDFRNVSELEFVDYSIGNWECKCGYLKGLNHLRTACVTCGHMVITDPFHPGDVLCHFCGTYNKNTPDFCTKCGDPVGLQLKYDQGECEERGMTYSAPLKVTIRLKIYDKDPETGVKSLRDMKEQEVFFGDIPLMSQNGTFIVNGTERVIVSQLHRSPGVFFETANNRTYFLGKIIPYRGSWVEFEYDQKNTLYVRIDRKRKFLGTIFLRALGLRTDEEILKTFYTVDTINVKEGKLSWKVVPEGQLTNLQGTRPAHAITVKGEELAPATRKISAHSLKGLRSHKIEAVEVETSEFDGAMTAADVVDLTTGERWSLRPNNGRLPWWIFSADRRVPDTQARDYLAALRLQRADADATVSAVLDANSVLFRRLWQPLAVAALNTSAEQGSARLFGHLLAETLGRGGAACRPTSRAFSCSFSSRMMSSTACGVAGFGVGERICSAASTPAASSTDAFMFVPPMSTPSVKGAAAACSTGSCSEELALAVDMPIDPSLCPGGLDPGPAIGGRTRRSRSRTRAMLASLPSRSVPLLADLACLDNLLPYTVRQLDSTACPAALPIRQP